MRAFLAIELDSRARIVVAGVIDRLVQAGIPGLRQVRPEGVHVTLKFLGNIDAGQVEVVTAAVSRIASEHDSFSLRLGRAGAFPNTRNPRVLWIGLEGEVTLLSSLQGAMEDSLVGLGFERERRGFGPHLTVARVKDGTAQANRRRAGEVLLSAPLEAGIVFKGVAVSLMRSTLGPGGVVYDRLASMPLGGTC